MFNFCNLTIIIIRCIEYVTFQNDGGWAVTFKGVTTIYPPTMVAMVTEPENVVHSPTMVTIEDKRIESQNVVVPTTTSIPGVENTVLQPLPTTTTANRSSI